MTEQAPAGWYPQPDGTQRYWDGQQWTDHNAPMTAQPAEVSQPVAVAQPAEVSQPVAVAQPAAPSGAAPVPGLVSDAPARPWWKMKRFIIPAVAVAGIIGISVAANAGGGGTPVAQPSTTPSQTPAVEQSSTPDATVAATFVMPDVVGANLQEAQDSLQALGSYLMDQTDASGAGRAQLVDSNWKVCTQEPVAGTEVAVDAMVKLGAVKTDESCSGAAAPDAPDTSDEDADADADADATDDADTSGLSAEQLEAVGAAESYLAFTAFSKKGLIDQLAFDGFSEKDATAAIAVLTIDWNDQAAQKADSYLDFMAFSKEGLTDQLKFDGFTSKQATAGVAATKADWNEQAAKKAEDYLDFSDFSKSSLIDQLEFDGFTHKQAAYGAKEAGL
jgi:hypothetical protein